MRSDLIGSHELSRLDLGDRFVDMRKALGREEVVEVLGVVGEIVGYDAYSIFFDALESRFGRAAHDLVVELVGEFKLDLVHRTSLLHDKYGYLKSEILRRNILNPVVEERYFGRVSRQGEGTSVVITREVKIAQLLIESCSGSKEEQVILHLGMLGEKL